MKKLVTAIALSLLAHCGSVFAEPELQGERGSHQGRAVTLSAIPQEDQWWSDYTASQSGNITQYVYDLSKSNPEAAAWFLLTGGKYGFASREATIEELSLLMEVGKRIKIAFPQTEKMKEWIKDNPTGALHFSFIYQQLDHMESRLDKIAEDQKRMQSEINKVDDILKDMTLRMDRLSESNDDKRNRLDNLDTSLENSRKETAEFNARIKEKQDKWDAELEALKAKSKADHEDLMTQLNQESEERANRFIAQIDSFFAKYDREREPLPFLTKTSAEREVRRAKESAERQARIEADKVQREKERAEEEAQRQVDIKQYGSVLKARQTRAQEAHAREVEWFKTQNLYGPSVDTMIKHLDENLARNLAFYHEMASKGLL